MDGSARDFDFQNGTWTVVNRRLRERWVGSADWDEFPSTAVGVSVLGGAGHMDQISIPAKGAEGLTLRLFDAERKEWSLYWASSRSGALFPPVIGRFSGARGEFYGDDSDEGRPVRVRYIWSGITPTSCRWEQAFSADGGQTWETNWTMEFTRTS